MPPALNISDLISSAPFQTSGSIPLTKPAPHLFFTKPDGTAGQLQFPYPAADSANFAALLESCKPASFGRGKQDVLDPSYRRALCLPADALALSAPLQLPSRILQEIQLLLQPEAAAVTAELYKLNIYGPEGFFKSHVDTPRAPTMFGSLVVCLPTEFAGGELLLRGPGGVQYTHNWGSPNAESPVLQWAAFYSDVEHEILPVTSGYRVTLTYNLYHVSDDSAVAALPLHFVNAGKSVFGESLAACLADRSWHSKGATLGFALEHYYAASSSRPPVKLEPGMLKGSDLLLYQTLENAGLPPKLAPLLRMPHARGPRAEDHVEDLGDEPCAVLLGAGFGVPQQLGEPEPQDDSDDDNYYDCGKYRGPGLRWYFEEESEDEFLAVRHGASSPPCNMVWAKPPSSKHWMYQDRTTAWGNESYTTVWYVAAALVAQVPACGEDCRAQK